MFVNIFSVLSRNYDFKVIFNELVFYDVCMTKYLHILRLKNGGWDCTIIRAGAIIGTNTVFKKRDVAKLDYKPVYRNKIALSNINGFGIRSDLKC